MAPLETMSVENTESVIRATSMLPPVALSSVSSVYCTEDVTGFRSTLHPLGIVRGVTVRSRNVVASLGAGLKSVVGGEINAMTTLCEDARKESIERMLENAAERGANGVVGVRYDTNLIKDGITEVIAYGMAVSDVSFLGQGSVGFDLEAGDQTRFVSTLNELPGYTVARSLGVVQGLTVRTRNVIANIGAGFKSLAGGEIKGYTKLCEDARKEAYERMLAEALEMGADGILAVRYSTNEVADGVTEVLAFGTAVSSTSQLIADDGTSAPAADGKEQKGGEEEECFPRVMVTTSNSLPGMHLKRSLGVVQGLTVRSSHIIANIGAGFKSMVGGEIKNWTTLCKAAREEALERMMIEAQGMGAKGIVAMRFDTNQVNKAVVEVLAYGTAVTDEPEPVYEDTPESVEEAVDSFGQLLSGDKSMVTTDTEIPGHISECSLGVVRGISVQTVHLIRGMGAALKSIVGGEIRNYTSMCQKARHDAFAQMVKEATDLGATGIIGMRYDSNDLQLGVIEVVAYGTAVFDSRRVREGATAPGTPPAATGGYATAPTTQAEDGDATGGTSAPDEPAPETEATGPTLALSSTNKIHGREMPQSLGVVLGITVRSRNIFANVGAGFKAAFVGGEIDTWRKLCDEARIHANEKMLEQAVALGAEGIVAMRYETNELAPGITEVLVYGTAVTS